MRPDRGRAAPALALLVACAVTEGDDSGAVVGAGPAPPALCGHYVPPPVPPIIGPSVNMLGPGPGFGGWSEPWLAGALVVTDFFGGSEPYDQEEEYDESGRLVRWTWFGEDREPLYANTFEWDGAGCLVAGNLGPDAFTASCDEGGQIAELVYPLSTGHYANTYEDGRLVASEEAWDEGYYASGSHAWTWEGDRMTGYRRAPGGREELRVTWTWIGGLVARGSGTTVYAESGVEQTVDREWTYADGWLASIRLDDEVTPIVRSDTGATAVDGEGDGRIAYRVICE